MSGIHTYMISTEERILLRLIRDSNLKNEKKGPSGPFFLLLAFDFQFPILIRKI